MDKQIKPTYIFGSKQRIIFDLNNKAKNFTLPAVGISIGSIRADKERLAAKYTEIHTFENSELSAYDRPTPITISLTVNIITKYVTDLWQIFAKLCSQFQPYRTYSWYVPQSDGEKIVELRNKITWDFNLATDFKETIKEDDEDRFIGKMNFDVEGWIFNNAKTCAEEILDIGTTDYFSAELEDRFGYAGRTGRYLATEFYKDKPDEKYKNPREFANAHPRIVNNFLTMYNAQNKQPIYFYLDNLRVNKNPDTFVGQALTVDGYNMKNATVLLVPKTRVSSIGKLEKKIFEFGDSKLFKNRKNEYKNKIVKGFVLPITDKSQNKITVDLDVGFSGECDIIICDNVDYDSVADSLGVESIKL